MTFIIYPPLHSSQEETIGIIQVKIDFLYRTHVILGNCVLIDTPTLILLIQLFGSIGLINRGKSSQFPGYFNLAA